MGSIMTRNRSGRTVYRYKRCGRVPGTPYDLVILTAGRGEYWFRIEHRDRRDRHGGYLVNSPDEAESEGRLTAIRLAKQGGEYSPHETLLYRYVLGFLIKAEWSLEGPWHLDDGGGNKAEHLFAILRVIAPEGDVVWNLIVGLLIIRVGWVGGLWYSKNWWGKVK